MRGLLAKPLHFAALVFLVVALVEIGRLHLLANFENRLSDFLIRSNSAELAPDPDIVIVDIDEPSLAKMQEVAGKFPWPRAIHAELLLGIESQQPRAIVFDMFFAEEDVFNRESDRAFNLALKGRKNVYLPTQRLDPRGDAKGVPLAEVAAILGIEATSSAQRGARIQLLPPQAVDVEHWRRTGIINFNQDRDGVGRRYWLAMPAYGWRLPSLPARVAGDLGFPVPDEQDIILHWRGLAHSFQHISYADLYEDFLRKNRVRVQDELKDKIVIVGSTATGLGDLRVTPISNVYPGAEILATAIDNLKNQRWMRRAPDYAQMALAALLLAFVWEAFRLRHNALEIGIAFGLISAALLGASYAALNARLILPVLVPLAFAWAFYLYGTMLAYLREKRTREQAVRLFSRFLDPNVVKKIVDHGETIESLSGKTRQISILFSDIRGFTTLSETRPPQEIVSLLNRYFSRQVEVVFRHGGTLDKFIGDCIMAFWGAPLDDPRHAEHAVAAALEMEQVLKSFKEDLGEAGRDFDVGIGIHSGTAVVGFIGAEQKLDYTAIGDAVNLASRIEGLTKDAGSRILVSSDTVEACHNSFEFTSRGRYKVKGRAQEVELFEPRPKSA
ncbi:MAG: adenylate/guanylate cyclase domain-containing protein [Burkholderiales bacterium]